MITTLQQKLLKHAFQRVKIDKVQVFKDIFANDNDKATKFSSFLEKMHISSSQKHRFLTLIKRVNELSAWKDFLLKENKKRETPWKYDNSPSKDLVPEFAEALCIWHTKAHTAASLTDQMFDDDVNELMSGVTGIDFHAVLTDDLYRLWRLMALRRVIEEALQ